MNNQDISAKFQELSTPLVADACVRLKLPFRIAPPGLRPLITGSKIAGRAVPARHYGSVDVFLEAMMNAKHGDILVIDNRGRSDEGCVGDLLALEAKSSGLEGIVIWGFHRDTADLRLIDLPLFSYGACPTGPLRVEQRESDALASARFGDFDVTEVDVVFADDDGAVFVSFEQIDKILSMALEIREVERHQAELLHQGKNLKEQLHFEEYLSKRSADPSYSFREHLRAIGGAIEE